MGNIFTTILVQPLTNGLILFYKYLGENLGVAIILFSIFLIFVLRPLTKPYLQSMKKIKDIGPQVEKLKKKFGSDKLKFSQAQAELYKQNKINPTAGCLPYILQFLVLIALFQVFTVALSEQQIASGKLNQLLYAPLKFSDGQALNTKFTYLNISKPDTFHIPGISFGLPGLFLILATFAQFLSVKITTPYIKTEEKIAKKTKGDLDDTQVMMQKSMTYMMPLMTLIFGLKLPSGLALYWLVYSMVNVWQQVSMSGWGSLTPMVNLVKSKLTKNNG
jgi:YidC/Oxa1 family membrane protein insertase